MNYFLEFYFLFLLIFTNYCYGIPSFEIDYEHNTFLLDGKPFQYLSGSLHYSRVPRHYWKDRLNKLSASGLDAVQTYVPWNIHEPSPGVFNFSDQNDLEVFLSTAQKSNLYVLLRIGPYICAEWDYGGLPAWLLTDNSTMVVRTMDKKYISNLTRWFTFLFHKIKQLLYVNGGPILMIQVENEYGSYSACDKFYMAYLTELIQGIIGKGTILYTTDGNSLDLLKCGSTFLAYPTVDFGPTLDVKNAFSSMRTFQPNGPLVNSEMYTGWMDMWGDVKHHTTAIEDVIQTMTDIWKLNASVNLYMFEGGTNFAYWNGADPPFLPQITSYDYDSPLTESGDITPKYWAIRNFTYKIKRNLPQVPTSVLKYAYGRVKLKDLGSLTSFIKILSNPAAPFNYHLPQNIEQTGHYYGYSIYRHKFKHSYSSSLLKIPGLRDRANILIDDHPLGILDRRLVTSLIISPVKGQTLDIVVENLGRINYGDEINENKKGIISNVSLSNENLTNWRVIPIKLENFFNESLYNLHTLKFESSNLNINKKNSYQLNMPNLYYGNFVVPEKIGQRDTFVDLCGFSWGQFLVNGYNLGRFRPRQGPQTTLYLPAPYLKPFPSLNDIILLETENTFFKYDENISIVFRDEPCLNCKCDEPSPDH